MYYIIHIATAFQSFKAQPREIQELIWARTLNDLRKKDPTHTILSVTLDQYLAKEAADSVTLSCLLKKKMALTPEFGHIIGIGKALVMNGSTPKRTVTVAGTIDDEKDLLQTFWQRLGSFTKDRGLPTFVTWNGLDFTFPFLIERSTALGVEPSCILPRARFQPWKHLDLFAELAAYDPHRYMSLQSRLSLWGLSPNDNGNGHHLGDHDALTEQWRKGNPKPLEENLTFTLEAIQRILDRVAPYFLETRNNSPRNQCFPSPPISES
jgi:Predicted 3'-5' exonuclease related to the exonuclease domain of PolB